MRLYRECWHLKWCLRTISCAVLLLGTGSIARSQEIPEILEPWKDWVTWGVEHRDCPTLYSSASEPICYWPSQLDLSAGNDGGMFEVQVQVFEESWVALPGTVKIWPTDVQVGEEPVVVVQRNDRPAVQLPAGTHLVSGRFRWDRMPQRIEIPEQIGILALQVDGNPVPAPTWNAKGEVWLKRDRGEPADKDLLDMRVYRVVEDGIPVWLRTEISITVSGKSREEQLGSIMPDGWQIATVESPIPVAVDDAGLIKAQVRAGNWTVAVHAFRTSEPNQIGFATDAQPVLATELVGLKTNPEFRISQIEGLPMIDFTQTTFPEKWRDLPIYEWDTSKPFQLVQKMRGMGQQQSEGLTIHRQLWLDEDGTGLTFQDKLSGTMQQIWRLDVADGHELGAVQVDGEAQLITANPQTDASGIEIRRRNLQMEAIGRVDRTAELPATGWQTDAESLRLTFKLPPGWRVFAVFGADQVTGDWLTAWSLLDLFLLLIFSLAVFRLYGFLPGLIALLAFGLAYHEPFAPRLTWLFVLIPLALLRVVGEGAGKMWILAVKYGAISLLLIFLIPFIAQQTQSLIYPQLESPGIGYDDHAFVGWPDPTHNESATLTRSAEFDRSPRMPRRTQTESVASRFETSNLLYDPKSKIQTGPAKPKWEWNNVYCVWDGPVAADQTIKPILISLTQHRILTAIRLVLLIVLAAILLGARKLHWPLFKRTTTNAAASLAAFVFLIVPGTASAQIPDEQMLQTLRQRLLEVPDAFPNAAEIPSVELTIGQGNLEMTAKVHAALDVAVPMPGQLPAWSPLTVAIDGDTDVLVSRRDGYLWVLVPKGVHDVVVRGVLPDQSDWEWTFQLKPRYVKIDAPGWKVTGIGSNGVPEQQVFFVKEQAASEESAAYDRTDFNAIVVVDRQLEIGLMSKVHTTVTRLSAPGKAISLQIPLLSGESVTTSGRNVSEGLINISLGARGNQFSWDSELNTAGEIQLIAPTTDRWVERWHVITSPIWNVSLGGLNPVFESKESDLIPVWHPWPGEQATVELSKPTAVSGDSLTVQNVSYKTQLGSRRRTSTMILELESSLANDFVIEIDPDARDFSLRIDNDLIPPQRDGAKLIVPVRPGKQTVSVQWKTDQDLQTVVDAGSVKLPVKAANVSTVIEMPVNRWVLWVDGPLRGPAVRFWTILAIAILAALALGSLPLSPLRRFEWVLLAIGLTQVHLVAAMLVVGWLFLLAWRGKAQITKSSWIFNLLQVVIVLLTIAALLVLVFVVAEGLLGNPDMFIIGNGSSQTYLEWFQPRIDGDLPATYVLSISVWFYRLLMLFWALWLASALLRWLIWGWKQFSNGGAWRRVWKRKSVSAVTDES